MNTVPVGKYYDLNIYCDGKTVGVYAYELRYDPDWQTYETNSSKYTYLQFDMQDSANKSIIAFMLQDYDWEYNELGWEDYDEWLDPDEFRINAPKILAEFIDNLPEYEVEIM